MHIPTVSAFLVVSLPLAYSKTVFIDGSCTVIPGWNDYWSEALSFSNRASERISSNSDVDFHNIFAKIFKTDIGSADGQNVKSIFDEIKALTTTTNLKESDIRLYCDNDSPNRWFQSASSGGYVDSTNGMVTVPGPPDCQIPPESPTRGISGRTYEQKIPRFDTQGHNPNRVTITFCDFAFTRVPRDQSGNIAFPVIMSDPRVAANRDQFHGRVIEQFSFLISGIIVHELAHAVSFSNGQVQILDLPDAARAYGWNNVLPNTAQTALKNADDYRYLALWAGVTDLGYTLPRQSDNDADNVKAAKITAIAQGVLFRYINLTTRSLAMIAKRFWA